MSTAEPAPAAPEPRARPKIANAALSVVLVADGAAPTEEIVSRWLTYLESLQREHELLLVTPAAVAERPNLRVLPPEKPGFGAALRVGIAAARHPLLAYAPADERYPPAELAKLLAIIDDVDLASGYRAGRPMPTLYRVTGFFWRCLLRILLGLRPEPSWGWLGGKVVAYQKLIRGLFGVRAHDVDSPFRLFRRAVFERIPIQSDSSFVHAEILAKMNFLGYIKDDYYGFSMQEAPIAVPASWEHDPQRWADLRRVFNDPAFAPAPAPKAAEG